MSKPKKRPSKARMLKLLQEHKRTLEIAKVLGTDRSTPLKWAKQYGFKLVKGVHVPDPICDAIEEEVVVAEPIVMPEEKPIEKRKDLYKLDELTMTSISNIRKLRGKEKGVVVAEEYNIGLGTLYSIWQKKNEEAVDGTRKRY